MHQPPPAAPPAPTITLMRLAPAAPTQAPTPTQTPTPTPAPTPAASPAPTHSDETSHHSLPRSARVEYGLFNVLFN